MKQSLSFGEFSDDLGGIINQLVNSGVKVNIIIDQQSIVALGLAIGIAVALALILAAYAKSL